MPKGIKGFQKGVHHKTEYGSKEENPNWMGNKVGYSSLHEWIGVNWGNARSYFCKCGQQALDWANITGKYNRDRNNWETMCRSCHKKFDKSDTLPMRIALAKKHGRTIPTK